jgi:hypothetical protein
MTPKKFDNRAELANAHPPNRNSSFFNSNVGFVSVRYHHNRHTSPNCFV